MVSNDRPAEHYGLAPVYPGRTRAHNRGVKRHQGRMKRRHSELKSSGTSPNFLITFASLKSPVAGSPVRLKSERADMAFFARKRLGAHRGRIN